MPPDAPGEITALLLRHRGGDQEAFDRLVTIVYERLRRIARRQLGRRRGATLDTIGLVHEAYMRLVGETGVAWQDRAHFFAIAARAMRRVVVDYARRRTAGKRGGGEPPLPFDEARMAADRQTGEVLAVDQALDTLASFNERMARVVECRFFAGLSDAETAEALGVSLRTVERDWTRSRAWLTKELGSTR
jgi:RNA polymerase sigma factor (TIGR02999 family)